MLYSIKMLADEAAMAECPEFVVDKYCWGGEYRPKVKGCLAFIKDKGFVLRMSCDEKDPVADYHSFQDPVYKDCAMEAFFDFDPEESKVHYVNFEMNSVGAMLNHFGGGRGSRSPIDEFTDKRAELETYVDEEGWGLTLRIPLDYIADLYGKNDFECGDVIRCNFYKIREGKDERCPEHYASFSPIETEKPDFHRPEFFAECILC